MYSEADSAFDDESLGLASQPDEDLEVDADDNSDTDPAEAIMPAPLVQARKESVPLNALHDADDNFYGNQVTSEHLTKTTRRLTMIGLTRVVMVDANNIVISGRTEVYAARQMLEFDLDNEQRRVRDHFFSEGMIEVLRYDLDVTQQRALALSLRASAKTQDKAVHKVATENYISEVFAKHGREYAFKGGRPRKEGERSPTVQEACDLLELPERTFRRRIAAYRETLPGGKVSNESKPRQSKTLVDPAPVEFDHRLAVGENLEVPPNPINVKGIIKEMLITDRAEILVWLAEEAAADPSFTAAVNDVRKARATNAPATNIEPQPTTQTTALPAAPMPPQLVIPPTISPQG